MIVHATAGGSGTWVPLCDTEHVKACTLDPDAVTCEQCRTLMAPVDLELDLVKAADEYHRLRDAGLHPAAETIVEILMLMSRRTYDHIVDLLDAVGHREHGTTVRFVAAPF